MIGDIYDAAVDPGLWKRALERCCAFVGGNSAVLYWHDVAAEQSAALHIWNDDPHYTRLYFEKYMPMNPVFPAATFVEPGLVYTPTQIIPEDELVETVFYKEWIAPQGIADVLAVNLEKGATSSSLINIRRDQTLGLADDACRARMSLLTPHLQRAVAIGRLFDQGRMQQALLAETLDHVQAAIFLVRSGGHVVQVNSQARTMLEEGTLVTEWRGVLTAVDPDAQRMLRDLIAGAERGDAVEPDRAAAIPLSASAQRRWFAHVLPLTAGERQQAGSHHAAVAAVFVRRTSPNRPPALEALARQFHLTASEVRVLDAMLKVSGVRALADLLGLSQATVKTHLHNLFQKTGAAGQSELVRLVAGLETGDSEQP